MLGLYMGPEPCDQVNGPIMRQLLEVKKASGRERSILQGQDPGVVVHFFLALAREHVHSLM